MDDEIKKRSTDCVYFLASPLTCKKGGDCEYRHCESARLNPRDCWYWLNGSCLNPTCPFRHPPVDGITEASSEKACALPSVALTGKVNVPCYFYFNSFCIKGNKCHFLHGEVIYQPYKAPKTRNDCTSTQAQETKASAGNNSVPVLLETSQSASQKTSNELAKKNKSEIVMSPKAPLENLDPVKTVGESPEISESKHDTESKRDTSLDTSSGKSADAVEDNADKASLSSDQSTDNFARGHSHSNEHWESSPGFDVLVDDGSNSEQVLYEGDADYHQIRERESTCFDGDSMEYNYEYSNGYDQFDYPDDGNLQDQTCYESYRHSDRGYPDYIHSTVEHSINYNVSEHSSERLSGHHLHRGEILNEAGRRKGLDLRHHSRKRRRINENRASNSNWRHFSLQSRDYGHGKPRRSNGISRGRLSLDERIKKIVRHRRRNAVDLNINPRRGIIENSNYNRHIFSSSSQRANSFVRRRGNQKHARLSEMGSIDCKDMKAKNSSTFFTGPKTLAQIKEEKKRATKELWETSHQCPRISFQGPKPLKELLKEKQELDPHNNGLHRSFPSSEENKSGDSQNEISYGGHNKSLW